MRAACSVAKLAHIIKTTALWQDYDFIMAVTGMTGTGKSTFSVQLAKQLSPSFSFRTNLAWTRQELYEAIDHKLPRYGCVIGDEAINLFHKRKFMEKDQIELLQLIEKCRYRNLCVILNVPRLWSLDKEIRETQAIKIWVHLTRRGFGYVFIPDINPFTIDVWHRKDNERLLRNFNKGTAPVSKSPNFLDTVEFDKLSDDEEVEYLAVKDEKRNLQQEQERRSLASQSVPRAGRGAEAFIKRFYHDVREMLSCGEDLERVRAYCAEKLSKAVVKR